MATLDDNEVEVERSRIHFINETFGYTESNFLVLQIIKFFKAKYIIFLAILQKMH